ncbi:MAG: chromate transporter [Eubacteriaceae bacterium]
MMYLNLFFTFFQIGLFTIGGGYAMIPLIQQEVVSNGWLTMTELTDFIAVAESTPGPFAVNISTFVGMETAGFFGAVLTTTAVVLPSFIIILFVARAFSNFQKNPVVQGALFGMRPVVVGLIASAVYLLMFNAFIPKGIDLLDINLLLKSLEYKEIIIFGICCFFYFKFKLHPIKLILLAGGLGMICFGVLPLVFGIA